MKQYALGTREWPWPAITLMEVSQGYKIPARLVNKIDRLYREIYETQEEILKVAHVTWDDLK